MSARLPALRRAPPTTTRDSARVPAARSSDASSAGTPAMPFDQADVRQADLKDAQVEDHQPVAGRDARDGQRHRQRARRRQHVAGDQRPARLPSPRPLRVPSQRRPNHGGGPRQAARGRGEVAGQRMRRRRARFLRAPGRLRQAEREGHEGPDHRRGGSARAAGTARRAACVDRRRALQEDRVGGRRRFRRVHEQHERRRV